MLSTGIRTDVGVKVYGQNLDSIYAFSQHVKKALEGIDGVKDLYVEPITGGKYIDIAIKRDEIARYNLSVDDVNSIVESAFRWNEAYNNNRRPSALFCECKIWTGFQEQLEVVETPAGTNNDLWPHSFAGSC